MKNKLVIVESPTKARTITRFLGGEMKVLASMGHIRDLPEGSLGVDVHNHFVPSYTLTRNGKKVVDELKRSAKVADEIYLATDPDREGEAISWHIQEVLKGVAGKKPFHRISFHEITRSAIQHAIEAPGKVDMQMVDAQQARRVLDRIVGYQVSPLLWKNVPNGTSAGRVQSVALRLICERQREIDAFTPTEYWTLDAEFATQDPAAVFTARLVQLDGRRLPFDADKKALIADAAMANALAAELEASASYRISQVNSKPKQQRAAPPFITSTLQQAAGSNLSMGAGQTMRIAQELYEGVDCGDGAVGLITYMRTDAFDVAKEAQAAAREYIAEAYGKEYVPATPNFYRSKASSQGAHEAIRPTDVSRTPESIGKYLSSQQARLYRLIWNRFMASQMAPAQLLENSIDVEALGKLTHTYLFRASATSVLFPGFRRVYEFKDIESTKAPEGDEDEPKNGQLPNLPEGTPCALRELGKAQSFTKPPPFYTEATLVKELELNGIGRPSTYATIVETIQDREYVKKEKGRLGPTPLGFSVNDYLVAKLPDLFQVGFTAEMEGKLDEVEEGKVEWTAMMEAFYSQFQKWTGGAAGAGAPGNERVLKFLNSFPPGVNWQAPVTKGRRTYDDKKFYDSLVEQAAGTKSLSDKQWQAILALAARYADQIPGLMDAAAETGITAELEPLIVKQREQAAAEANGTAPAKATLSPEAEALVKALAKVKWEDPVTRGRRTYDDGKFYRSLARQATGGGALSLPQTAALKKLALRYQGQVADFAALSAMCALEAPAAAGEGEAPAAAVSAEDKAKTVALLAMLDSVTEWAAPQERRGRTYDDKKFYSSLKDQFARRQALSPKQFDALLSIARKYGEKIPDFAAATAAAGISAVAEPPKPVDAKCPQCGAALVQRRARGRAFYGCSAYPKCRFASNTLPS